MDSRLFADVVVAQLLVILQLLAVKDQALLVWRDAVNVLNLPFQVVDTVAGLHIQSNQISRNVFVENLECRLLYKL